MSAILNWPLIRPILDTFWVFGVSKDGEKFVTYRPTTKFSYENFIQKTRKVRSITFFSGTGGKSLRVLANTQVAVRKSGKIVFPTVSQRFIVPALSDATCDDSFIWLERVQKGYVMRGLNGPSFGNVCESELQEMLGYLGVELPLSKKSLERKQNDSMENWGIREEYLDKERGTF